MTKIDATVLRETKFIATVTVILSMLLQAVFLIASFWSIGVILGNLLGAAAAVGNFFLMGLFVQKAVAQDEKDSKATVKASQSIRTLMLFAVAVVGALVPCFNVFAVIIPLFFPRIAIAFRPFLDKKK